MTRLPDALQWAIPRPSEFSADGKGVAWRFGAFEGQEVYRGEEPAFDLDEFCLLSRGSSQEERKRRAAALAERWGSPLTLCGICHKRHIWDKIRPRSGRPRAVELADTWWSVPQPPLRMDPPGSYLGDKGSRMVRTGSESVGDWLTWANVINALRRVYVANRDGRAVESADVELFWPGGLPAGANPRVPIGAVVNQWLSATCVSPALGYPLDPPGAPPIRVVQVGSVLAWFGWVLREEFTAESGSVIACPECGMTERLKRAGDKSRTLCARCYDRQSKRDERSLAELGAEHEEREGHGLAPASVEALAGKGVVISNTGETPRLVRPPVQSPTEPPDSAYQPSPEARAALAQWRKSPEGRASIRADRLALPDRIVR